MIYLFAGNDTERKSLATLKFLEGFPKEVPIYSIGKDDFDKNQVGGFYSGAELFSEKSVIIFSQILEKEEIKDFILENLSKMANSGNVFVFKEGSLKKAITDSFKKNRAELNIFEKLKEREEKFNNFILANALGSRDKLNLWTNFRRAMDLGVGLEELVGVLFWKAKDMLLKKNFTKFKEEELQTISSKLAYLLPLARQSGNDAEAALEEFLLEVV
jgi:hypothetical protein